jgi:hypothetical protein
MTSAKQSIVTYDQNRRYKGAMICPNQSFEIREFTKKKRDVSKLDPKSIGRLNRVRAT